MKRLLLSGLVLLMFLGVASETASATPFDSNMNQTTNIQQSNRNPYSTPSAATMGKIFDELCAIEPSYTHSTLQGMYTNGRLRIKEVNKDEFYHVFITGLDVICVILDD